MSEEQKQIIQNTLCNNNLQVQFNLKLLKKKLKELKTKDEDMFILINNSLEVLRTMKKQGQSMENRLKLLKTHIEACGFKRIKKGK